MSLDLTAQEVDALWMEAEEQCPPATSIDRLETIYPVPSQLGSGSHRVMELSPGLELRIFQETYKALSLRVEENQHPVQFMVYLSGGGVSEIANQDATQGYIGGSGIQRAYTDFYPESQSSLGVNIEMQPHLLNPLFATPGGELPIELQPLVRENDGQQVFSPQTTRAMRSVVQNIIDCSLVGATKLLYLQGKVFELMALQLDAALENKNSAIAASLKPDTIARIHYAAEILRSQLERRCLF